MTFWILVGVMTVLALAFVVVPIVKPGVGRKPLLIGGLAVVIPLVAVLVYQKLGTPTAATQPVMPMPPMPSGTMPPGHPDKAVMNMDLGQLADKLAEKLKSQPDNAEGWALLARTYVEVKRHKEAVPAFEKATALLPKDPQLLVDYADALAMSNGGKFDSKSVELVDRALTLSPSHPKALMLKATIEFNSLHYGEAIKYWEKLLTVSGLDVATQKEARGSIEEARRLMAAAKP
jgi:cytochrome c-type biogenesis protein CcmH